MLPLSGVNQSRVFKTRILSYMDQLKYIYSMGMENNSPSIRSRRKLRWAWRNRQDAARVFHSMGPFDHGLGQITDLPGNGKGGGQANNGHPPFVKRDEEEEYQGRNQAGEQGANGPFPGFPGADRGVEFVFAQ